MHLLTINIQRIDPIKCKCPAHLKIVYSFTQFVQSVYPCLSSPLLPRNPAASHTEEGTAPRLHIWEDGPALHSSGSGTWSRTRGTTPLGGSWPPGSEFPGVWTSCRHASNRWRYRRLSTIWRLGITLCGSLWSRECGTLRRRGGSWPRDRRRAKGWCI